MKKIILFLFACSMISIAWGQTPAEIEKKEAELKSLEKSAVGDEGLCVQRGTSVTAEGIALFGNPNGGHIAIDNDDIQRKSGNGANYSTLFHNYYGGNVSIAYGSDGGNYNTNIGTRSTNEGQLNAYNTLYAGGANNRVGIGTTSPSATLHVKSSDNVIGEGITLENDDAGGNDFWSMIIAGNTFQFYYDADGAGTGSSYEFRAQVSDVDGVWSSSSDRRYKKNINVIENGVLAKVLQLKPSKYNYKNDKTNKLCIGFIAQEVQDIFPELVTEIDGSEGYLGLSYSQFSVFLTKAIQEQQVIITDIQEENTTLKSEITDLKTRLAQLEAAVEELTRE